jgi:hypothetical protein
MFTKLAAIEAQAMKLDSKSRAKLAQRLIRSLDDTSEAEIERLWIEEAKRRVLEIRSGRAVLLPAADVLRRVRREISRKNSRSTG